jgi:DNA-binding NarL/FixJ family response regulator
MTSVALYSEQPMLAAGLQAALADLKDCTLSAVFTDLDPLMDHVRKNRPSVVLIEATAAVTFATLSRLKSTAGDAPIVLWVDVASVELISQVLAMGVRGILRKSLPVELQIKCLRNVAAGDLWLEQTLCDQLLTSRRVFLSRRERQLMNLLAQGLKNKEIASTLKLTESTVKVYLSRLFQKVGVHGRFEIALLALRNSFADAIPGPALPGPQPTPAYFLPKVVSVARPVARVA